MMPKSKNNKAKNVEKRSIHNLSLVELKALAYDMFEKIQEAGVELAKVNDIIKAKTNESNRRTTKETDND